MKEELELNKIHNIDCLEFMKTLPDKCIDLVLTDPPYGIGADKGSGGGSFRGKVNKFEGDWDNFTPSREYFDEIFRISKNQIIFGGNYFLDKLYPTSCFLVWDKRCGVIPERTFADGEIAWTSFKQPLRIFRFVWDGMIQQNMKDKEIKFHPTQKPVELMKWCVDKFSKEDDIIFDPFTGGGSSLMACKLLKRNYIGCEISKEYCEIAEQRIKSISNPLF